MMNTNTTMRKIYAFCALDDFILVYPFYTIFMAAKGLSLLQISSLLVLWSAVDLVTNVPTGVLADKYSRKNLLALGQLLKGIGFAAWFLYPHYVGFAIGFVLWGVGGAFTGGTFEALVYDELKAVGQERQYVKVIGRTDSFALMGNLLATLAAGAAILLGYGFLFAASIAVILSAAAVAFRLPETPRFEEVADAHYLAMLRAGVKQAVHNHTILGVILLGGFIGAVYGALEEYVPLFVRAKGVSLSLVSFAVGATVAAAALGSFMAYRYEKLSTARFMAVLAATGGLLVWASVAGRAGSVLLLVGYTFLIRLLQAIYDGKLQHSITSGLRATVTSFGGFVVEIFSIGAYLLYGVLTRNGHSFAAFKFFGVAIVAVAFMYAFIAPKILSRQTVRESVRE